MYTPPVHANRSSPIRHVGRGGATLRERGGEDRALLGITVPAFRTCSALRHWHNLERAHHIHSEARPLRMGPGGASAGGFSAMDAAGRHDATRAFDARPPSRVAPTGRNSGTKRRGRVMATAVRRSIWSGRARSHSKTTLLKDLADRCRGLGEVSVGRRGSREPCLATTRTRWSLDLQQTENALRELNAPYELARRSVALRRARTSRATMSWHRIRWPPCARSRRMEEKDVGERKRLPAM